MKRIAILIATTGGPVLVDRITPEPAPQSMVCLRRQSDVLPISADYDDFVRPGSGVIMREFGPYEEGAFRLDVSGPIGTGLSWQLGVYAAHAVFKSDTCELSDLDEADEIIWLSGTVDYDLNVGDVDHMAEKVESSAIMLADFIAKGTPIIFAAGIENAKFLADHKPPAGIEVLALQTTKDLMQVLGLVEDENVQDSPAPNKSFWPMAALAVLAVGAIFAFTVQDDEPDVVDVPEEDVPLEIDVTSDRGENPLFFFGDDLNLIVEVSEEAWVTCFYHPGDGKPFQLYPNAQVTHVEAFEPDKKHILSGGPNSSFVIRLGPPAGHEKVSCYASEEEMDIDPAYPPKDAAVDVLEFDLKP
ncbi:DUF4384 domain-containing protein [Terasakiella sp. A23]|uniref:DUF4384 domain-containing protein n=1 Tax=Terasakiella sp. FCG-A23 TaxID=3080561 RepID=UPI002954314C|nr:DUF4384 domain-containing protein [Terasakiella sp. A23]MDV7338354.1 DUF4384 domain-containing protein [Terasakiella sp. A23]